MFDNELRKYVGKQVQIVTPMDTVGGILLTVTNSAVAVRSAQYPGYGGTEDVTVLLDVISYVWVFV